MNANSASCQMALQTNHCEFESSVNAANNIVFFSLCSQATCLRFFRSRFRCFATPGWQGCPSSQNQSFDFRSERRGDERGFGLAQDYRAAGSGARVRPKRLSSFLVSSRRLTAAVRHDSAWLSATFVPSARQQFTRLFNNGGPIPAPLRSIQTALVEDFCAGREFRISVQDRSEF